MNDLQQLIGKPIYAIRNFHIGYNTRNFYISTLEVEEILIDSNGIWFNVGMEIIHESELGHRFNFNKDKIQATLKQVKNQPIDNITEIFKIIKRKEE